MQIDLAAYFLVICLLYVTNEKVSQRKGQSQERIQIGYREWVGKQALLTLLNCQRWKSSNLSLQSMKGTVYHIYCVF